MNKSTEVSNTHKPANCGYTVLPAVFIIKHVKNTII